MDGENGTREPKVYVRFGPLPNQEIPLEWAEGMLSELFESQRARFGKLLTDVVTAERMR